MTLDLVKVGAAKLRLLRDPGKQATWGMPYLAVAVSSLLVRSSESVDTVAVDQAWRMYCNPGFVDRCDVDELAGVIAHEVGHLLRSHHDRWAMSGGRVEHQWYWNIAGDMAINEDLLSAGVRLPDGVVTAGAYGFPTGLFTEEYFALLVEGADPDTPDNNSGGSGAGGGDGTGDGTGAGGDGGGDAGGALTPGAGGDCGSCCDGQTRRWDEHDADGLSPANRELVRRATAREIQSGKYAGTIPGGFERWADTLLNPVVDWRRWLSGQITSAIQYVAGKVDYTYRRPHRRGQRDGIVFPSMQSPVPTVRVVVDTSGSMSTQDLTRCLSEIDGILKSVGTAGSSIDIVFCDVDADVRTNVRNVRDIALTGGGGTDMRIGITAALEMRPRPDIVIVLTDGYTPWPEPPVKAKLIAGLVGEHADDAPDWIPSIRIPI